MLQRLDRSDRLIDDFGRFVQAQVCDDTERDHITLPRGEFTTNLVGAHIDWSFNPRMFLNTFFQYNNETDSISSNIRFRFIHHPLSDIYVVYNDVRDRRRELSDRSVTVKYTHLFSF